MRSPAPRRTSENLPLQATPNASVNVVQSSSSLRCTSMAAVLPGSPSKRPHGRVFSFSMKHDTRR